MMEPILAPFAERGAARDAPGAAHPVRLEPDRHLDHGGAGDRSRTTGRATCASPCASRPGSRELLKQPGRVLLEVGPGPDAQRAGAARAGGQARRGAVVPSLRAPATSAQSDVAVRARGAGTAVAGGRGGGLERRSTAVARRRRCRCRPTRSSASATGSSAPTGGPRAGPRRDRGNKRPTSPRWFYVPSWKRSLPPALRRTRPRSAAWLLSSRTHRASAERLVARLQERAASRSRASFPGDGFAGAAGRRLRAESDGAARLRAAAGGARGVRPSSGSDRRICGPSGAALASGARSVQELGFYSLRVSWPGRWAERDGTTRREIAGRQQRRAGRDGRGGSCAPERATLLGPCKVIPQEYPQPDLPQRRPGGRRTRAAGTKPARRSSGASCRRAATTASSRTAERPSLGAELRAVAAAGGRGAAAAAARARRLSRHRGLGGIGLEVAECLAREARARLVLVGRAPLPARTDWERWLAAHGDAGRAGAGACAGSRRSRRWVRRCCTLQADAAVPSR